MFEFGAAAQNKIGLPYMQNSYMHIQSLDPTRVVSSFYQNMHLHITFLIARLTKAIFWVSKVNNHAQVGDGTVM